MYSVPYECETFRPVNDMVPGNETSDNPVEFDIAPAWGPDLARVKSIIYASAGLIQAQDWTREMQQSVIAAFESGGDVFVNTVIAVRGLTIPMAMAKRAGIVVSAPNPSEPYAIRNGLAFSKIAGAVPAMALHVAYRVANLSKRAEMDPRFFARPSGSGGAETPGQGKASTAGTARRTSRRRATAGRRSTTPADPPSGLGDADTRGTSSRSQS